jgi:predicted polyphosphate/ATP-dependent NAD kinase
MEGPARAGSWVTRQPKHVIVIATLDELHGLDGPLRVDTGGDECARLLEGYVRVVTLPRERVIWRVMA